MYSTLLDEITPFELVLPKNTMASKEYLYGKEFSKLILHNWPKQVKNLKLVLRCGSTGHCKFYMVSKTSRTFPITDYNFFWFEYDMMRANKTIYCVLM
jgi:hypothetical protein